MTEGKPAKAGKKVPANPSLPDVRPGDGQMVELRFRATISTYGPDVTAQVVTIKDKPGEVPDALVYCQKVNQWAWVSLDEVQPIGW